MYQPLDRRGIGLAALAIALGSLTTSATGFVRAFVVAQYFGAHTATDAFFAAFTVPQILYYQLIGGAVSAVLIPSFSRLAAGDENEFWVVVRTVFVLEAALAAVFVGVLEFLAQPLMLAVASGFQLRVHVVALSVSVGLVRVLLPSIVFSTMSAVALAVLYSLGRRTVASFAPSLVNLGIIVAAFTASTRFGIMALALGAVVGSALQLAVQLPVMTRARRAAPVTTASPRVPFVDFRHPAIRTLARLSVPVAAITLVNIAGQVADLNFKSHLPEPGGLSAMQFASQLAQAPIGLVSAAIALAILPVMAARARDDRIDDFAATLLLGIRVSLVLIIPAMVGLLVLAGPVTALVYEHGRFTQLDGAYTVRALMGYAPQAPLVAIDQLLIFAFYARRNSVVPACVGFAGAAAFVALAFALARFTILGLALAGTTSVAIRTLILLVLVSRIVGGLWVAGLLTTICKILVAGAAMAAATRALELAVHLGGASLPDRLGAVLIPGIAGLTAYAAVLVLAHPGEIRVTMNAVLRTRGGRRAGTAV